MLDFLLCTGPVYRFVVDVRCRFPEVKTISSAMFQSCVCSLVGVRTKTSPFCRSCAFNSSRKSILLRMVPAKSGLRVVSAAAFLVIVCCDSGAGLASSEARIHDSGSHCVNGEATMEGSL